MAGRTQPFWLHGASADHGKEGLWPQPGGQSQRGQGTHSSSPGGDGSGFRKETMVICCCMRNMQRLHGLAKALPVCCIVAIGLTNPHFISESRVAKPAKWRWFIEDRQKIRGWCWHVSTCMGIAQDDWPLK